MRTTPVSNDAIQLKAQDQRDLIVRVPGVGGTWRLRVPEAIISEPTGTLLAAADHKTNSKWQSQACNGCHYAATADRNLAIAVHVKPVAEDVLQIHLRLTNHWEWPLWQVEARIGLYPDQGEAADSYADPNLERTFVVHDGKPTPLVELLTQFQPPFLVAEGQPNPALSMGAYKRSILPTIAEKPWLACASKSGKSLVAIGWTKAAEVMHVENGGKGSMNISVVFDMIAPNEDREMIGRIYFMTNDPDMALDRYVKEKNLGLLKPKDHLQTRETIFDAERNVYGWVPVPPWAKETLPEWVMPYLSRHGLDEPFTNMEKPIGPSCDGVDLWQANRFIVYRPETADYLYKDYSPTTVEYKKGTYPYLEQIVAKYTAGLKTDTDKAVALLTKAMPDLVLHPAFPPRACHVIANRAMDEESLAKSGTGWCNEQARLYVRLCQVAGIPARLIFLQYSNRKHGHVVTEFWADQHWALADASWFCVMPGPDGKLMSAAECHEKGIKRDYMAKAYAQRFQELLKLSDEEGYGTHELHIKDDAERKRIIAKEAALFRKDFLLRSEKTLADFFWQFGVLNYPLPK